MIGVGGGVCHSLKEVRNFVEFSVFREVGCDHRVNLQDKVSP